MYEGPMYETDYKGFKDRCQITNMYEYDIQSTIKDVPWTTITKSQFDYIIKCQKDLLDAYKYAILHKQPDDKTVQLANVAIELLKRFKENRSYVIEDCSRDTNFDFKVLHDECEEYADKITQLSGIEFELENNCWEELNCIMKNGQLKFRGTTIQ